MYAAYVNGINYTLLKGLTLKYLLIIHDNFPKIFVKILYYMMILLNKSCSITTFRPLIIPTRRYTRFG